MSQFAVRSSQVVSAGVYSHLGRAAIAHRPAQGLPAGYTGPASAARLITATERERPHFGHELRRAQEWCSAVQPAHLYERCRRISRLATVEPR